MADATTPTTTTSTSAPQGAGKPGNTNIPKASGKTPNPGGGNGGGIPTKEGTESQEPKRYKFEKLKFKGKEIDFEGDENEVKRIIMRGLGSDEAYNEAKRMRLEAERKEAEFYKKQELEKKEIEEIASNPTVGIKKAIQRMIDAGVAPEKARKAVEDHLYEEIQRDEMSAEAKRAYELEQENKRLKAEREEEQRRREEHELNQSAQEQRKVITQEMLKHMDAFGLAKTAGNLATVARRLQIAHKRGQNLSIEKAVELTHQDNQEYVRATTQSHVKEINEAYKSKEIDKVLAIGKELESFLGEETIVALQRYGIVKFKNQVPKMPQQTFDAAKTESSNQTEEKTYDELLEERKARARAIDQQRALRGAAT